MRQAMTARWRARAAVTLIVAACSRQHSKDQRRDKFTAMLEVLTSQRLGCLTLRPLH